MVTKQNSTIRTATPQDQACISTLLSGFHLPLDGLENAQLWVLEVGGKVVGVAA
jgi:hypothetical protein